MSNSHDHQLIIICIHLRHDPALPCIRAINDSTDPRDSGETFLCLKCTEVKPWEIPAESLLTACKGCCKSFTIVETFDARTEVVK